MGVNDEVTVPGTALFLPGIHVHGGPAPVRRLLLPELDERRATKVLPTL